MSAQRSFHSYPLVQFYVLVLGMLLIGSSASAQVIYQNDFSQYSMDGLYTEDDLDADWAIPRWEDGVRENRVAVTIGADSYDSNSASLVVSFPEGGAGTKNGGAQWILDLPGSYRMVRLEYRVMFGAGFDFVRGGKLPGLAGGTAPTGNAPADGFNGWTGRMMWRTDYRGTPGVIPQNWAYLSYYLKHPTSGYDQDGRSEDDLSWGRWGGRSWVTSGRWYRVTQLVLLNDAGQPNGRMWGWLNGRRMFYQTGLTFRHTEDLGIDKLYFSNFFGGGGSKWAPSKDEVMFFDDFDIQVILE